MDYIKLIDKYYADSPELRHVLLTHSRQVADAVLCIYCNSLELLESDKRELLETLQERFSVNSVRVMPELLERVERNLL